MIPARAVTPDPPGTLAPEAPLLTLEHLRRELSRLHEHRHRTLRSAVFARLPEPIGPGEQIEVTVMGAPQVFRVVVTCGELDLRRALLREEAESTVYVVPFARQLPRDVEAALAGGRLWSPEVEGLLARRFGARTVTPRLRGSRVRTLALAEGARVYARGDAASVDVDDAWLAVLRDRLGLATLESVAQLFVATLHDRERRGKPFGAALEAATARAELEEVLVRRMGPVAKTVLAAWLADLPVELASLAVVGEAARPALVSSASAGFAPLLAVVEMRVLQTLGHPLRPVRDAGGAAGLARALVELGELVPLVWPRLAEGGGDPLRRAILGEAEKVLGGEQVRPFAKGSNRLAFVAEQRSATFVEALSAVSAAARSDGAPGEALAAVDAAATALLAHDVARGDEALREQVLMASRLAAFLAEPIARTATTPAGSPHEEVVRLARFQADVGGWVDHARQVVRGDVSGPLGRGLSAVLAEVDRVRDALDERFARSYSNVVGKKGERGALRGSVKLGGQPEKVLLIEDVIEQLALSVLAADADLDLLVLCLDGMSTANLAELWAPAGEATRGSPVGKTSLVPVSVGPRWPVLAHVPTITKLSRSALFAGRALLPGESLDTQRDGDRLAHHAGVKRFGPGGPPVVLLRADVLAEGGGLADDAGQVIRSKTRVVGVVVNAIDDQLKGSAQLRVRLTARDILPLVALLDEADRRGRLVLLVSDHGNIPSQRIAGQTARGGEVEGVERGARYRALAPSEGPMADEIELPAGALGGSKSGSRLAVAVHERLRYSPLHHAGEHGGAGLAEVIAPAVLLAPTGLLPDLAAHGVAPLAIDPPGFWDRERAAADRETAAEAAKSTARQPGLPRSAVISAQTALPLSPPLAEALFRSALFREQVKNIAEAERPRVERAIDLLLRHGGRLPRDRFAADLGIAVAGSGARVAGFLGSLEKVLNFDQEPVVGTDPRGQIVTLDIHRLQAVFLEGEDG